MVAEGQIITGCCSVRFLGEAMKNLGCALVVFCLIKSLGSCQAVLGHGVWTPEEDEAEQKYLN